jgi:hypothetical protein
MSDFARIEQRQCYARTLQTVDEAEPFDWTPEVDLVKGLLVPARVQVLLDYFDVAKKRASARSQVFVHTVIQDSGLDGEGLAARLRDDAGFAALFEGALEAGMRSAHDQKVQLLARVVAQAANDTASRQCTRTRAVPSAADPDVHYASDNPMRVKP